MKWFLLSCFLVTLTVLSAQSNTDRDTTFKLSFDGIFGAIVFQPNDFPATKTVPLSDGKILLVGVFSNSLHTDISGVARLHADGSWDNTFKGPRNSDLVYIEAYTAHELPDGKVLVGGNFIRLPGSTFSHSGLMRLNTDGSVDTTFKIASPG